MHKKQRIVIVGGGFGGLGVALQLARRKVNAEIILIDSQPYHLYTPWLYRIPSDAWHKRKRRMCEFYYTTLLSTYKDRIYFREGRVDRVNTETRHIVFDTGDTVHYDHIVYALGSSANFHGMEDIANCAYTLNTPENIMHAYEALMSLLHATKKEHKKQVVIVGAGATGIEAAMELGYLRKKYALRELDITLIDSCDVLCQRFSSFVQVRAQKRAEFFGLRVFPKAIAKGMSGEHLLLRQQQNDITISADLILWAGGVKPNAVLQMTPYAKDDTGRLIVNEYMEIENGVYALGDSASVWDAHQQGTVPPSAWAAVDQSRIVTETIIRRLEQKQPQHIYKPPRVYPGVLALGGKYAVGGGYGIQLSGFIGWVAKQFIHIQYFLMIMNIRSAMRTWLTKTHVCDTKH